MKKTILVLILLSSKLVHSEPVECYSGIAEAQLCIEKEATEIAEHLQQIRNGNTKVLKNDLEIIGGSLFGFGLNSYLLPFSREFDIFEVLENTEKKLVEIGAKLPYLKTKFIPLAHLSTAQLETICNSFYKIIGKGFMLGGTVFSGLSLMVPDDVEAADLETLFDDPIKLAEFISWSPANNQFIHEIIKANPNSETAIKLKRSLLLIKVAEKLPKNM